MLEIIASNMKPNDEDNVYQDRMEIKQKDLGLIKNEASLFWVAQEPSRAFWAFQDGSFLLFKNKLNHKLITTSYGLVYYRCGLGLGD